MARKENKEIKKAMDIIDEMSMDEKEWELYWSRKFAIMDYNTGMYHAKEKGLKEGKMQDAKELLKMGMSIEDVPKGNKTREKRD